MRDEFGAHVHECVLAEFVASNPKPHNLDVGVFRDRGRYHYGVDQYGVFDEKQVINSFLTT